MHASNDQSKYAAFMLDVESAKNVPAEADSFVGALQRQLLNVGEGGDRRLQTLTTTGRSYDYITSYTSA